MKFKHVIWDWNGTLVDDTWLFVDIMNRVLKDRNLPGITLDDYRNMFDFPETIPLYGIVIESWWIDKDKVKKLNR